MYNSQKLQDLALKIYEKQSNKLQLYIKKEKYNNLKD